jgi:hypothetical protein
MQKTIMFVELFYQPSIGTLGPIDNFRWSPNEFLVCHIVLMFPTRYDPPFI